jgi:hypothetical protein
MMRYKVFVSYKRDVDPDETLALEIYQWLRQNGHEVFIDHDVTGEFCTRGNVRETGTRGAEA